MGNLCAIILQALEDCPAIRGMTGISRTDVATDVAAALELAGHRKAELAVLEELRAEVTRLYPLECLEDRIRKLR